ncbi:hypothetical protein HDF16_003017 [Granulicella aggregans]|uniref:Uncharacterized protein n=1 Tax=Granulicella aggregans TaxID=474949 RepID=A0A7W7ZEL6_9BACT|nr:hypothetical protein [Granulicella aggregans]
MLIQYLSYSYALPFLPTDHLRRECLGFPRSFVAAQMLSGTL